MLRIENSTTCNQEHPGTSSKKSIRLGSLKDRNRKISLKKTQAIKAIHRDEVLRKQIPPVRPVSTPEAPSILPLVDRDLERPVETLGEALVLKNKLPLACEQAPEILRSSRFCGRFCSKCP